MCHLLPVGVGETLRSPSSVSSLGAAAADCRECQPCRFLTSCLCTGYAGNNYKGSIYMVFDYMDHDLTGLLERMGYKLTLPQASLADSVKR